MIDCETVNKVTKQLASKLLQMGGEFIQLVEAHEKKKVIHVACERWRAILQEGGITIHNAIFANQTKHKFKRHNVVEVVKTRFKGGDYKTNAFVFCTDGVLPTTEEELCSLLELGNVNDSAHKDYHHSDGSIVKGPDDDMESRVDQIQEDDELFIPHPQVNISPPIKQSPTQSPQTESLLQQNINQNEYSRPVLKCSQPVHEYIRQLQGQIRELQEEIFALKHSNRALANENHEKDIIISNRNQALEDSKNIGQINEEIFRLTKSNMALAALVDELTRAIKDLKSELHTSK